MYNQEQFLAEKFSNFLRAWGEFHYIYTETDISEQCMNNVLAVFDPNVVELTISKEDDHYELHGRIKR